MHWKSVAAGTSSGDLPGEIDGAPGDFATQHPKVLGDEPMPADPQFTAAVKLRGISDREKEKQGNAQSGKWGDTKRVRVLRHAVPCYRGIYLDSVIWALFTWPLRL